MARSCSFDRQEKLTLAMELFWQKGFAQTSISDLVEYLNINRFSLYNSFGDKLALYRECLTFYLTHYSFNAKENPLQSDASMAELEAYLVRFVAIQKEQKYGCFMQNAVLEKCLDDECVQAECERLFQSLQQLFTQVLRHNQALGLIKANIVPVQVSAFLVLQLQGIRVLGKAGQYAMLDSALAVIRTFLHSLNLPHQSDTSASSVVDAAN